MMARRFGTAAAFRHALEQRIRTEAQGGGVLVPRIRQVAVFERFVARLMSSLGARVVVKVGFAMELRLHRARSTRDVDLRVSGNPDTLLDDLQAAGRMDLSDFMTFEIEADRRHAVIATTNPYPGLRFRSEARLAGKLDGEPFHVDVVAGGLMPRPPDRILAGDFFGFAGLPPFEVAIYPRELHIAEKLHAYTFPYPTPNSRVRDLPDLALLAKSGELDARTLHDTISAIFVHRATHPTPLRLPDPPAAWKLAYANLAQENALPWSTLNVLFRAAEALLNPMLMGTSGLWSPQKWFWMPAESGKSAG